MTVDRKNTSSGTIHVRFGFFQSIEMAQHLYNEDSVVN